MTKCNGQDGALAGVILLRMEANQKHMQTEAQFFSLRW